MYRSIMVDLTGVAAEFESARMSDFTDSPVNRENLPRLIVQVREDACLVQMVNHYRF